ncbi:MAG TPA: cytochrome P450 [Solirubrobacteraceae bacterium]|nr:cytochrome P450 [Solirubrobacteraceae bacterium]
MTALGEASLKDIDLTDLDRWAAGVPHDWFALLRRESPVFWQGEHHGRGFWSLTRYDDILAASKDWETFSSERGGTSLMDLTPEQVQSRMSMLDSDPPRHKRLRSIVNKAFALRVVNAYGARIRAMFREVLQTAFAERELDFVDAVAVELPMRILCELMGVPLEDRRYLVDLGNRMLGNTDPDHAGDYVAGEADLSAYAHLPFSSPAAPEMFAYANALAAERRRAPRDDLTTRLLEAEIDGDRLSEHEFDLFFLLLVTAGNETTRHAMSNGLLSLLEHPEERDRVLADPTLIPSAVEEILRWRPSLLHFRRTATRDVELRSQTIREGDKVALWYVSGNRDEEQFPDAGRFDVTRRPNRHLAFGLGGPHFCLGAHLARLELCVWLEEMLPVLGRLELAGEPQRLRSNFFHGVKSLPVRVP